MKVTEPYIFISYSHKDKEQVFQVLDTMKTHGYRFWYDKSIHAGEQWTDELAESISGCAVFVPFLSEHYDKSKYCLQELRFAKNEARMLVPVWLSDKRSLSGKVRYQLEQIQGFSLNSSAQLDELIAWVDTQPVFQSCHTETTTSVKTSYAVVVTVNPPVGPSPRFVGREDKLSDIESAFRNGVAVVDLYGLGGIGKSEICRKLFQNYTHGAATFKEIGWVLWKGTLEDTFYGQFPDIQEENAERYWRMVRQEYLCRKDLLIILDNANNFEEADADRLIGLDCCFLITSRKKLDFFYAIPAGTLTQKQCRILYRRERRGNNTLTDDSPNANLDAILHLAANHTLAVKLLAKTQQRSGRSTAELLEELRKNGFDLTDVEEDIYYKHNPERGDNNEAEQRFIEHFCCIFDLSALGKGSRQEETLRVLQGMSLLATNVYIPENTVKKWLELRNLNGMNRAIDSGWLNVREDSENGRSVAMHPVAAAVVRHVEMPDTVFVDTVAGQLRKDMIVGVTEIFTEKLSVLEHAVALDDIAQSLSLCTENYSRMLYQIGVILNGSSAYKTALLYLQRAVKIEEFTQYDMCPETAATYNEIGFVYRQLRNYRNALVWFRKALRIRKKILGSNHVETSQTLNNIAIIYYYQGQYERSLKYYKKVLAVREKVLGVEHPLTAFVYNSIGNVYLRMGEYEKALQCHQQALTIWGKTVSPNHPNVAFSYNNIARVYAAQGNYEKALEQLCRAFHIRKNMLGLEHHDTVQTLLDIGEVYYKQCNYATALEWLKKAQSIGSTVLGDEHPLTKSAQEKIESIQQADSRKPENERESAGDGRDETTD